MPCIFLALTNLAHASETPEGQVNGAAMGSPWAVPFIGLLLSIALVPLIAPAFWHHNYGRISAAWGAAFIAPFAMYFGPSLALHEFLHVMLLDFIPFITVLFALYTISGGVFVEGNVRATPIRNTSLLAFGALIASIAGTTGASVLLIRPLLRANASRRYNVHVVIFFIFLVSNIGGSLTPLGDPPLYIGFLKGVDFFWPAKALWSVTLLVSAILLTAFFLLDTILMRREPLASDNEPTISIRIRGYLNIVLLAAVIAVILASASWQTSLLVSILGIEVDAPNVLRVIALLGLAAISLMFTPQAFRAGNDFTWGPIKK